MEFGVAYNTAYQGVDPDRIAGFAVHAEECGFAAFYVPEHIVLYPGAKVGPFEMPPGLPIADPLETLSFVAGVTGRILLGTGVLIVPFHHPVVLAKRLATLDALSKGRMRRLTVGVGSLPGEAAAVGVDFASRGRVADEAIDILRLLWTGGEDGVSFHGEFFDFDDLVSFPKPLGEVPIQVGGSSRAAARRAGTRGDGYFPGGRLDATERAAQWEIAQKAAAERGRTLAYTRWGSIDMDRDRVEELAAQGVTRIVVNASGQTLEEQKEELSAFAERFALG
ncbi:TIGR03619 family F420-dependent LLM class oxidoreductase [Nonomuraea sp. NBC_01738]|uniref:TIGR03619 family F420-dependent LLM class oxidoreductase n=1 Tax=Nonomuraea sp. NBC_01738 TaxID=2976003 RepID=UPI002E0EE0E1|nr:TIGR03619 family F420-dependent LLM class oxidoreductase [Nonomuraea sp. NBC_01738]